MKRLLGLSRANSAFSGLSLGVALHLFIVGLQADRNANNSLIFRGVYRNQSANYIIYAAIFTLVAVGLSILAKKQGENALAKYRALKDEVAGLRVTAKA